MGRRQAAVTDVAESGPTVLYGWHAVEAMLRHSPERVVELWVQAGRADRRAVSLIALAADHQVQVQDATRERLDRLCGEAAHQGVVARVRPSGPWDEARLFDLLERLERPPLLLVLDGLTDPHNLGACLRSADAAGVDAVIATRDRSAGLSGAARKVAAGAAEFVPFVAVTNLVRTLESLKQKGVWVAGLAGEASSPLHGKDLTGALAIVAGAEGEGLRRLTREHCDYLVRIPMSGHVESLNVSVSVGVALFEAVRQRMTVLTNTRSQS